MTLLSEMIREEWRIHSTLFGNKSFALFVPLIFCMSALFSLVTPMIVSIASVYAFAHYAFFAFGMAVGSFGLMGRETLNMRFGETSYLAYSSRILPLSIKKIFLNFALKDTIYYMAFFIVPFCVSFTLSSFITPVSFTKSLLMFITLPLSFLLGLSISFFLSTIYSKSRILGQIILLSGAIYIFLNLEIFTKESVYQSILPTLSFIITGSYADLFIGGFAALMFFAAALLFFSFEYRSSSKGYRTIFKASKKPSELKAFMLKDLIDLHRSQGGFGKIIFSFAIPVFIVEVMINFILRIFSVSSEGLLILMSVVIGVTASNVYNWLSEFDDSHKYLSMPISPKEICFSKSILSIILGWISGAGVLIVSFLFSEASFQSLAAAFFAFSGIMLLTTSVLVYLTGLKPNVLMLDSKKFLLYILALSPAIIAMMLESFEYKASFGPSIVIFTSAIFALLSVPILKKGISRISLFEL